MTPTTSDVEHGTLPYPQGAGHVGGHSQGPSRSEDSLLTGESPGTVLQACEAQHSASAAGITRQVSARHGSAAAGTINPIAPRTVMLRLSWYVSRRTDASYAQSFDLVYHHRRQ